jgi:large subunit ribosomal protein L14e
MIEIGRLCVKTAGRDSGCKCAVIDIIDNNYVMIDGETRRRKCSVAHLEPLDQVIQIEKNASHSAVSKEFEKLGFKARETKPKEKTERPKKLRGKAKAEEEIKEKPKKKEKKKEDKKKEPKPKKKPA